MFEIRKDMILTETEKLLYNIFELLKDFTAQNNTSVNVIIPKQENNAVKSDKRICKHCGKEFDNQGLLITHIRQEHKKGGK
jgi:hypothetical protein